MELIYKKEEANNMRNFIKIYKQVMFYCLCVFFIGVVFAILTQFREEIAKEKDFIGNAMEVCSLVIAIISVGLILAQLLEVKRIQEAEFVIHLNQTFVDNEEYAKMYKELEKSDKEQKIPELSRVEVSNYLTFFETIYLLVNNGSVKMRTLDDLFGYRFFLAIHNETVQKIKLVESPYNFRNIYYLESIWMEYRKKKGLLIYGEEKNLYQACVRAGKGPMYNAIMNDFRKEEKM